MDPPLKPGMIARGRGACSNRSGRFEQNQREAYDDGWRDGLEVGDLQLATTVQPMRSRTIIARNTSPDIGFDRSINPYRGCSHGCIYCYARPAHAYLGHSPGLDFETKLYFKPEAGRLLAAELARKGYKPGVIHIGGDTDPYQPDEKRLGVTRALLETLQRFRHPFSIITKSALILRDLDILGEMGSAGLARAAVSITTLDRRLARSMEPRAATPERRIEALRQLSAAGVPTAVMFAPSIPALNDHEMEAVLERAAGAGARTAGYVALRLPLEIRELVEDWLATDHPDRAKRVMSMVRQMRGGAAYNSAWGSRMTGQGPVADAMRQRFDIARRRFGLDQVLPPLDLSQFSPPRPQTDQLQLF
jgi:DNA repair photolyase